MTGPPPASGSTPEGWLSAGRGPVQTAQAPSVSPRAPQKQELGSLWPCQFSYIHSSS